MSWILRNGLSEGLFEEIEKERKRWRDILDEMAKPVQDPFIDKWVDEVRKITTVHSITNKEGQYEVKIDVPGYSKKDFSRIEVHPEWYYIEAENQNRGKVIREGRFASKVDADTAKVSLENGVLTLIVTPVKQPHHAKKLTLD